ncbi:sugar lactone lactonase YvrE [Georgenia soli]|uniref:Sugar lactone lactonase YvrE n=1 Tax=Georgenia soli TaxID=638953 RepID=A0A2A9F1V1_9MICO|nr:sugar lactone lactonase YvrE [Georgenia soli]
MAIVEQITAPVTDHGEGPVWSPTWGGLRFVDMLVGDVLTLGDDGEVLRCGVGRVAAFVRPRSNGGYVVATEHAVELADEVAAAPSRSVEIDRTPGVRMNEGTAAPDGSLYVGSTTWGQEPEAGALFRVTPDLEVRKVLERVTISNGLGFSPDGTRAYYVDSGAGRMDVFDVADGAFHDRRPLVTLSRRTGDLDGLAVDVQGTIWVAVYGAGQVHRYSPEGAILEVLDLPVPHVTACALGGPTLTDLFITTSRGGLGADASPAAGAVFMASVDVPGQPVLPFAG